MLYDIQVHIPTATICGYRSRAEADTIRPWGARDDDEPFAIFSVDLSPGESIDLGGIEFILPGVINGNC
jgi:hypothetical protein